MSEEYLLTQDGAEKMRKELEDMKTRQREELAKRLRFAIQQGDLSEIRARLRAQRQARG